MGRLEPYVSDGWLFCLQLPWDLEAPPLSTFLRAAASGMAAARDVAEEEGYLDTTSLQTNVSRFLPYPDFVLNGTSCEIRHLNDSLRG